MAQPCAMHSCDAEVGRVCSKGQAAFIAGKAENTAAEGALEGKGRRRGMKSLRSGQGQG